MFRKDPDSLADFFSAEFLDLSEAKLDSPEAILDYDFRQELKNFINLYDFDSLPEDRIHFLAEDFLASRWHQLEKKPTAYTALPTLPSTQFCLRLAEKLSELCPVDEKDQVTNRFMYLMPTVQLGEVKPSVSLSEILVTERGQAVLIDECLLTSRQQKRFCYLDQSSQQYIALTKSEVKHIKKHSAKTAAYFFAVEAFIDDCCVDTELEALIFGLLMRDENLINKFELFLEELKRINQYDELMKKGHRVSMSNILQQLKQDPHSYLGCADLLKEIRRFNKHADYVLKKYPELSPWVETQIDVSREAYCKAVKENTLQTNTMNKMIEAILSFPNRELRDVFSHKETDVFLKKIWKYLTIDQKNQLVGVLDIKRLSNILEAQADPKIELSEAQASLKAEISRKDNSLARQVLRGISKDCRKANSQDLIALAVIAHRTAVGVREPFNTMNLKYCVETVNTVSENSRHLSRTTTAATSFTSVLLYGVMAALLSLATGGTGLIGLTIAGAVVAGLGATGFGYKAISSWMRPQFHRTTLAALSFLRSKEFVAGEKFVDPVEVKVEEVLDPEKLPLEERYKLGC